MRPDVVLLNGDPMRLDEREVNVVKGDGKYTSIAATSIVAKVERDALMCRYAKESGSGFDACKGCTSTSHIEAIKRYGLHAIHRATFCTAFTRPALFSRLRVLPHVSTAAFSTLAKPFGAPSGASWTTFHVHLSVGIPEYFIKSA